VGLRLGVHIDAEDLSAREVLAPHPKARASQNADLDDHELRRPEWLEVLLVDVQELSLTRLVSPMAGADVVRPPRSGTVDWERGRAQERQS
jgi:hypothetical protein